MENIIYQIYHPRMQNKNVQIYAWNDIEGLHHEGINALYWQ